jgi:hypothetical protein
MMRKGYFIFYILLLVCLIESANAQSLFKEVEITVKSDQRPLKDAVISDGINVYQTNSKGKVQFKTQQPFVFLSYPSGHIFEVLPNGSVDFFRRINAMVNKKQEFVFHLKKNTHNEVLHHFIAIADPQIQSIDEAELFHSESIPDLKSTVKVLDNPNVFGVTVGDIVFDRFNLFEPYNESVKSINIPFFHVVGNHDIDLDAQTHERSLYPYLNQYGPEYYSFNRGDVHYVVLSSVYFLGNKQYVGYLNDQQLIWLNNDLSLIDRANPLVIFLHVPSTSAVTRLNAGRDSNRESVINNQALYELLNDFKDVHLISGHVHWNEKTQISSNIMEHNTAAISGAWWAADICYDGSPKGYGVYQIDNSSVSWYYKAVGKPINEQFRVYVEKDLINNSREFLVNVWNWDPEWKVQWFENGIYQGDAVMSPGFDPLSVEIFSIGKKREKHPWITPQKTNHLFKFTSNNPSLPILLQVIDRFGNIYEQIIEGEGLY